MTHYIKYNNQTEFNEQIFNSYEFDKDFKQLSTSFIEKYNISDKKSFSDLMYLPWHGYIDDNLDLAKYRFKYIDPASHKGGMCINIFINNKCYRLLDYILTLSIDIDFDPSIFMFNDKNQFIIDKSSDKTLYDMLINNRRIYDKLVWNKNLIYKESNLYRIDKIDSVMKFIETGIDDIDDYSLGL